MIQSQSSIKRNPSSTKATCDSNSFNSGIINSNNTSLEEIENHTEDTVDYTDTPVNEWDSLWCNIRRYSKHYLPTTSRLSVYSQQQLLGPMERNTSAMSRKIILSQTIPPEKVSDSWIWKDHPKEKIELMKWNRSYCQYMHSVYIPNHPVLIPSSKKTRQKLQCVAKCKAWLNAHEYWMNLK